MRKHEERLDPNSCWNKAKDMEMVFVILGRDAAARAAVEAWIDARIKLGWNQIDDEKIKGAREWIKTAEYDRTENVLLRFDYFKKGGKYYTSGELEITETLRSHFFGCIYPKDFGLRARDLKMLPGMAGGEWSGPFVVTKGYTEFIEGIDKQ